MVSYPALPERGVAGPVFLVEAYRQSQAEPALSELVEDRGDPSWGIRHTPCAGVAM